MKEFIIHNLRDMFIDYIGKVIDDELLFANTCDFYSFIKKNFIEILDSMEVQD